MTTRAGLVGLLTGLAATVFLVYPFALAWPAGTTSWFWIALLAAATLTIGGGALAARWSGSVHSGRCAALGGLAGGLAGTMIFCLLGAAAAGLAWYLPLFFGSTDGMLGQFTQIELMAAVIRQTQEVFMACFLGGSGLGLLGGWLARPRLGGQTDVFDKSEPQMALNAAITAAPASVVAVGMTAFVFSRLAEIADPALAGSILDWPLGVSLLLVLVSHLALTLVIPHEAREAEHLCGMDEVKMAAYVGIGVAPALAIFLLIVRPELFSKPLVWFTLLSSAGMSLKALQTLLGLILPRRACFPVPQKGFQTIEATLFGTIANSRGPRLMVLCIGCGLLMVLPLHIVLISVLVNLSNLIFDPAFAQLVPVEAARKLCLTQALVSTGLLSASTGILSILYLFYLNLGRWFNRWGLHRSAHADGFQDP
jgi:hypothetical protein